MRFLCKTLVSASLGAAVVRARGTRAALIGSVLASLAAAGPSLGETPLPPAVDMSVSAERFPGADAVYLRWEQNWYVFKDGTVSRRDHTWLKLFSNRPEREFADQRVDYCDGREEFIVHTAQTHLPGGDVLPVPDYSFNVAAPDDVSGWPAYAGWQQQVVSFSGVQPGAVLELDTEVRSEAGMFPWVGADLRLNQPYPTIERVVSVTAPQETDLLWKLQAVEHPQPTVEDLGNGLKTIRWVFKDLRAWEEEPGSPDWRQTAGRLRFSTASSPYAWAETHLRALKNAAQDVPNQDWMKEAIKSAVTEEDKVLALHTGLQDRFNYLDSWKTLRPLACRTARQVQASRYGNPLEAAALWSQVFHWHGLKSRAWLALDGEASNPEDRCWTQDSFDGVVLEVEAGDEKVLIHPRYGVIHDPDASRHLLLVRPDDVSGKLLVREVKRRTSLPNSIGIAGRIAFDEDGGATGTLEVEAGGAFFDPSGLSEDSAKKSWAARLLGQIVPGAEVEDFTVSKLADERLNGRMTIRLSDGVSQVGPLTTISLVPNSLIADATHMPLDETTRRTNVDMHGIWVEHIDVTVTWPTALAVAIAPSLTSPSSGPWAHSTDPQKLQVEGSGWRLENVVTVQEEEMQLHRSIEISEPIISDKGFQTLAETLNRLRSPGMTCFALEQKSGSETNAEKS